MLNVAMSHFQSHITSKPDMCSLSFVDLLHVSNFKGGNASITEPIETLPHKLVYYERAMKLIEQGFRGRSLSSLNNDEKEQLIQLCTEFLSLTEFDDTKIRGFGASYASALLAAHFIDVIPVLDRRALNGAGIQFECDKQKQVKKIAKHFGQLIEAFSQELQRFPNVSLREQDKKWFSKAI